MLIAFAEYGQNVQHCFGGGGGGGGGGKRVNNSVLTGKIATKECFNRVPQMVLSRIVVNKQLRQPMHKRAQRGQYSDSIYITFRLRLHHRIDIPYIYGQRNSQSYL